MVYSDVTDEALTVSVKVNEQAMELWARQYAPYVEVLEPVSLRGKIRQALQAAVNKYNDQEVKP